MLRKFKTIFFLISLIIFVLMIINYYFSEENVVNINKSRATYSVTPYNELPILKNDTKDIIVYQDGLEQFKKKRKKRFWEKLLLNDKQ